MIIQKRIAQFSKGNTTVALETLRRAGKKAEDKGLQHVTIKEVKEESREAKKLKKFYTLSKLNEHQRIIYEILEKVIKMPSGVLYKEYWRNVSKPVVPRAYRNYMKKMVDLGLVNAKGKRRWKIYEIVL